MCGNFYNTSIIVFNLFSNWDQLCNNKSWKVQKLYIRGAMIIISD